MGVGAAAGAIIGGFVGANTAVAVGTAISVGFSLGHSYDNYKEAQEMEKELSQSQTYSFGPIRNTKSHEIPIPVVYGRNRVAGNIIYQKVTGENDRYMDIQVALSEGSVNAITDVRADEKSISVSKYLGTRTQSADSVNDQGQTFPYTAYISKTLDAEKLEISGTPTITSIIEGRTVEVWDGNQWVTQYSNNPAYCLLDFLTSSRYGLGIDKQYINLDTFKNVADYCNEQVDGENRFELNMVIDSRRSSLDIIQDMLSCFRSFLIYTDGELKLKVDAVEAPVQSFDMDNIVEDSFSYNKTGKDERYNQVIVNYTDPNEHWEKIGAQYSDDSDIEQREVVKKEIPLIGINRFSQAGREARFFQKKSKYCPTFSSWKAGIDSIHCEVGDVVTVSHDVPGWTSKEFRILQISEAENDEMEIVAQEYNEAIYSDDGVVEQITYDSDLPNPFEDPSNVTNLTAIEGGELIGDGTYTPAIEVSWTEPGGMFYKYANVYYKVSTDADWKFVGRTEEDSYTISPVGPETYDVKVISENRNGIKSDFGTAPVQTITINGDENPPADITFATCTFENNIVLQLNAIDDERLAGYEIRKNDSNWSSDDSDLVYRGNSITHIIEDPGSPSETFYAKAITNSGVYSANADSITLTNAVPPQPVLSVNTTLSQIILFIEKPDIKDFQYTEFQIDTDSNFGSPEIYTPEDTEKIMPAIDETTHYIRARVVDIFNQSGPWSTTESINPEMITKKDMQGDLFQINPSSNVTVASGNLEDLWDRNNATGPEFNSAPIITFEFPMSWYFDMVKFYPSTTCNYYVEAYNKNTDSWEEVIGTSTSMNEAIGNDWNVAEFDNNKRVVTDKMRITFDSPLTLYELKFWTITMSDEILAQVLTLTGNMKVQSEDGSTYIDSNGIVIEGSEGANKNYVDNKESDIKKKPQGAQLFHFDRGFTSTNGLKPLSGYDAIIVEDGEFGKAADIISMQIEHGMSEYTMSFQKQFPKFNDIDDTQADFQEGTLNDVNATSSGELELAKEGADFTDVDDDEADFGEGTLTNTIATTDGLELDTYQETSAETNSKSINRTIYDSGPNSGTHTYTTGTETTDDNTYSITCSGSFDINSRSTFSDRNWTADFYMVIDGTEHHVYSNSGNGESTGINWSGTVSDLTKSTHDVYIKCEVWFEDQSDDSYFDFVWDYIEWDYENTTIKHYLEGNRIYSIDLTPVGKPADSLIEWQETLNGETITIETSVDGQQTWQQPTNGGSIPNLPSDLDGVNLDVRQTLNTEDYTVTPILEYLKTEVISAYNATGYRLSPIMDISATDTVMNSNITWNWTLNGQTATIETNVSLDGTWQGWKTVADGDSIPDLPEGTDISNARLQCRQTLDTADTSVTPAIELLEISIEGAFGNYIIRSDGAKWLEGNRDDSLDTSFASNTSGVLTLSDSVIDELMISPKLHSADEVTLWENVIFNDGEPIQSAGSVTMTEKGVEVLGADGDRAILNDDLLAFYKENYPDTPHYYSKRVAYGVAQDEDYIDLASETGVPWDEAPKVQTAIKSLISYNSNYSATQEYHSYVHGIDKDGFYVTGKSVLPSASQNHGGGDTTLQGETGNIYTSYGRTDATRIECTIECNDSASNDEGTKSWSIDVYYQESGDSSWTFYKNFQDSVEDSGAYYSIPYKTYNPDISGLPAGEYRWRINVVSVSGAVEFLVKDYIDYAEEVIDNGEVMWIAIEGGAD